MARRDESDTGKQHAVSRDAAPHPVITGLMSSIALLVGCFPISLVCGIATTSIAENKGQLDPFRWFFPGFLLTRIGVAIAVAAPVNQDAIDQDAVRQGKAKACPKCAEVV